MRANRYRIAYRLKYERRCTILEDVCSHDITDLGQVIMISNVPGEAKPRILPRRKIMLYSKTLITCGA